MRQWEKLEDLVTNDESVSGKNWKFWPQMTLDDDQNGTLVIFGDDINL